jgi:hypothetical protein
VADSYVEIPPDSTGKKVDMAEVETTSGLVHRQRMEPIPPSSVLPGYAEVLAVVVATTVDVLAYAAPAGWGFEGVVVSGNADGLFTVLYGADTAWAIRTNAMRPSETLVLPRPDRRAGGTLVKVRVTNLGLGSANYQVALFGL